MRNLSHDELRALLTAARAQRERDWLMILCAFSHGLRVSELLSLQSDSVTSAFLKVVSLKGSENSIQALIHSSDPLFSEVPALFDYARKRRSGERLFKLTRQRFWQIVKQHGLSAGIPRHRLFPHALRHTCAMQLIDAIGINRTQKYMRHKSMSSTGEYLKVSDEEASRAAKEVFEKPKL